MSMRSGVEWVGMAKMAAKFFHGRLRIISPQLGVLLLAILPGCRGDSTVPVSPPVHVSGNVAANTQQARDDTDRAFELIHAGKFDAAGPLLERAIVADTMYGPAHNDLGLVYFHQDRAYEAAREFDKASKLMPRRGEPLNNLGLVYEQADKWADAETAYASALELDPVNTEFAGNLARMRIRRGERDEATRKLLELLVLKDSRPAWVDWARSNLHRTTPTTAESP